MAILLAGKRGDSLKGVLVWADLMELKGDSFSDGTPDPYAESLEVKTSPFVAEIASCERPDFFDGVSGSDTVLSRLPVRLVSKPVEWKARGVGRTTLSGVIPSTVAVWMTSPSLWLRCRD